MIPFAHLFFTSSYSQFALLLFYIVRGKFLGYTWIPSMIFHLKLELDIELEGLFVFFFHFVTTFLSFQSSADGSNDVSI